MRRRELLGYLLVLVCGGIFTTWSLRQDLGAEKRAVDSPSTVAVPDVPHERPPIVRVQHVNPERSEHGMTVLAKFPTSHSSVPDDVGQEQTQWSNTQNVVGPGNGTANYASGVGYSEALRCCKFDFSDIPAGSTINSISVTINCKQAGDGDIKFLRVQLNNGVGFSPVGSNLSDNSSFPLSFSDVVFSGDWGFTPSISQLSDDDFGVLIQVTGLDTNAEIDYVSIAVDYDEDTGGGGDDGDDDGEEPAKVTSPGMARNLPDFLNVAGQPGLANNWLLPIENLNRSGAIASGNTPVSPGRYFPQLVNITQSQATMPRASMPVNHVSHPTYDPTQPTYDPTQQFKPVAPADLPPAPIQPIADAMSSLPTRLSYTDDSEEARRGFVALANEYYAQGMTREAELCLLMAKQQAD